MAYPVFGWLDIPIVDDEILWEIAQKEAKSRRGGWKWEDKEWRQMAPVMRRTSQCFLVKARSWSGVVSMTKTSETLAKTSLSHLGSFPMTIPAIFLIGSLSNQGITQAIKRRDIHFSIRYFRAIEENVALDGSWMVSVAKSPLLMCTQILKETYPRRSERLTWICL